MKIHPDLVGTLAYESKGKYIHRYNPVPLFSSNKKKEFANVLMINEGLETKEDIQKLKWYPIDISHENNIGYCICCQNLKYLYYIFNDKENVYQVGVCCVEKNISEELATTLKKMRKKRIKREKELKSCEMYLDYKYYSNLDFRK